MRQGETDPIWKKRLRQKPRSEKAARIQKLLKQFDVSQWWDPDDIAAKQYKQIARLLAHAQSSIPHYAAIMGDMNPYDINSLKAGRWLDIPVLKRDTVNRLGEELLSRDIPKSHGSLGPIYTSGTTGKPVRVVRTSFALAYWSAFTTRDHIWHNRNIKGTLAAIRSSEKGVALYPDGAHHVAWGSKNGVFKTGLSTSLNVNTSIADMAEWIERTKPDYLLSLPNIIKRLAPYCIEHGFDFPFLKGISAHGEMVGEFMRQQAMEAWNTPVHDMYTSREVGYMALQCPVHDHYHVQSEGVYLEILGNDDQPCKPGDTGRVVVTTLQNYAMPLIRYQVGDYAEVGELCDCGRGMPVLNRIMGREQDILVLPTSEERWTLLGSPDVRDFMETAPIAP
ncbi:MAG: phenylacetate--CoA ligase family protein, partial [Rhodospirillales bacterium]|nr:phenylacetate--CoA ligase family protein [Rhodospirillales bacterium]